LSSIAIRLHHLTKKFNLSHDSALHDISTEIPSGQIVGLVGPDGAGKTTLLRILSGLLKATSGSVEVLGYDPITNEQFLHREIGYMPQRFGLYEDLTVIQNLKLYADLQGVEQKDKSDLFHKLLSFAGLTTCTARLAKDLSGGMKQKLAVACTLLKKPKLLLLDEPSVGVDPISRRELWKMIEELSKEHITIIWSTSYLDEAEKCHSVMLLQEGRLIFSGEPDTFTKNIKGRALLLTPPQEKKRSLLSFLSQRKEVIDCVIQGRSLRVVLHENETIPTQEIPYDQCETKTRFEDAFVQELTKQKKLISYHSPSEKIGSEQFHDVVIEVKNVSRHFNHFCAVDNMNFQVQKGEIFGLLGPNGAGKSTTFKMLCGLLKPTKGTTSVLGISLEDASSKARSQIGYMAQKFSLYADLSVYQNLKFFAGIYPVPILQKEKVIQETMQLFNLLEVSQVNAKDLSLGFKQRLSLACSLMHKPKILFLDEPTSGVDPITRREFWSLINQLVSEGMTVMITTHFMDEAEYCDRIGLINKGKLIMLGSPDELKKSATSPSLKNPTLEDAFIILSQQAELPS
jgi:ABC-2 type transport system ATP-binding protein